MADHQREHQKQLLITGASGGMGRASALLAASEGYDLILADLSLEKLEALAAECAQLGVTASCQFLDVTSSPAIEELVASLNTGRGLDGIIHTVGLSPQMADARAMITVDLVGTVELLERVRPCLQAGGCAVVIASMSAYMVPPNEEIDRALADPLRAGLLDELQASESGRGLLQHSGMAYAYAKRALKQYVADHAGAWGRDHKRIVSISPGLIDTAMGRLENDAMDDFAAMLSHIALERLGEPEDIAHAALFLVSARAAYITGCDILVDGGFVASVSAQPGN